MKISKGCKARVVYVLYNADNNEVIEQVSENNPVVFNFGTGMLLEGFETNLSGLSKGDTFDFVVKAKDAYGPRDSYAVFDLPKDTFAVNGKLDTKLLKIGNRFPMQDNNGNQHEGMIISIHEDTVTMDFNHPLAGIDLRFVGKVIEVILEE